MEEDPWNPVEPFVEPRLVRAQAALERAGQQKKQKRKRQAPQQNLARQTTNVTNTIVYQRCFLVEHQYQSLFCHSKGSTWPGHYLNNTAFKVTSTDPNFSKFVKLTLASLALSDLNTGYQRLSHFVDLKRREPQSEHLILFEISPVHCTLCFSAEHPRKDCNSCSYCFSDNHRRNQCEELKVRFNIQQQYLVTVVQGCSQISEERRRKREIRRRQRRKFAGIWFRIPHRPRFFSETLLRPIGLPSFERPTVALDTEGNGLPNQIGSIHISGWFGNDIRVQTVYYAELNCRSSTNPQTWITGLQIQDLLSGISIQEVKKVVLRLLKNKRVITHGGAEFANLGISTSELISANIEHLDLQQLLLAPGEQAVALHYIDQFLFPTFPKLKRENVLKITPGHSPERDSRVTLRCYVKYVKTMEVYGQFPTATVIRGFVSQHLSFEDWENQMRMMF